MFDGPSHADAVCTQLNASTVAIRNLVIKDDVPNAIGVVEKNARIRGYSVVNN
jgi:hypothetical protein